MQSVESADHHIITDSKNWEECMEALKRQHTTKDNVSAIRFNIELNKLKLLPSESPNTLISRARLIASNLKSIGQPVTYVALVSAVINALQVNTHCA